MSHLKRQAVPKTWPVHRKGTTFVVSPSFAKNSGIPVLIVLRDMLKVAEIRGEVKKAINSKLILINNKEVKDDKQSMLLFDTLTLVPTKQCYRLILKINGKFDLEKISEAESSKKISKIVDKKVLKGKKMQLNLSDGRNVLSNEKCKINDSVLINLKSKKIEKCIVFKEGAKVFSFGGKHTGKTGKIISINPELKIAKIDFGEDKIDVLIKQLIVIE